MSFKTTHFGTPEEACLAVGVDFDGVVPEGGTNRRLNVSGDPRGKGDGNIYTFPDGNGGCVTNFKSGEKATWGETSKVGPRKKPQIKYDARLKELWRKAQPVKTHPYCERKCIKPTKRVRQITRNEIYEIFGWAPWKLLDPLLCIPLTDGIDLVSMQFIDIQGKKSFLKGHKTKGAYWFTGKANPAKALGIAEGVATAISVATVNKFPVIAAMSSSNLLEVAKKIRTLLPDQQIYLIADAGNGEKEAHLAAHSIGAQVAVPVFTEAMIQASKGENLTDFNDYYKLTGALK